MREEIPLEQRSQTITARYRFLNTKCFLLNSKLLITFTDEKAFLYHTSAKFCFKVIDETKGFLIESGDNIPLISQEAQMQSHLSFPVTCPEKQWSALCMLLGVCHVDNTDAVFTHKIPGCFLLLENSGE